ncbi:hypothetical protein TVAG_318390 [Trichomonas vaginalis G3]|uniref:Uncharacterized protein n=1 Tax=Trichomonas vaginalis (strain ATCC PRA-98 / G3) TaxID=412133 RepID=A2G3M5_TRIV3|nr:hypothetical protein TVAGG3_0508230 [Trichomonas vaginalis G3]EAX88248.1 hypothetical protein TVAG_318390 [Trichomonas vaginalis G3]KAI5517586.1 hypothetical protein TVAGG3_0508230 [Trichomonas vaginalis G3]|eukprot:XP_001301178.1 hypothetical protein [Trichomonas vaginalis G3]
MSVQKINNLLNNGEIINFNLISDQLKYTLIDICNLLQEHSASIKSLQEEVNLRSTKKEVALLQEQVEDMNKNNKEALQSQSEKVNNRFEEMTTFINKYQNTLSEKIDYSNKKLKEEFVAKEKDLQGDIYIANQQIREINVKIISQSNLLQKSQAEIQKINKLLDTGKDKSLELLALRIEGCENKLNILTSESTTFQNDLTSKVDECVKLANTIKKDYTNEMHALSVDLNDVKHMVVDVQVFQNDGTLDTPALIRALQRDSRRIDKFDETINAVKEDHLKLNQMCMNLIKTFNELQVNMGEMVGENNNFRRNLMKRTDENQALILDFSDELVKVSNNVHSIVDSNMNSTTLILNSFIQLSAFIQHLTNRQVPVQINFDDAMINLQQQNDSIIEQNEKLEEKVKNAHSEMKYGRQASADFTLPITNIPIPEELINQINSTITTVKSAQEENLEKKEEENARVAIMQPNEIENKRVIQGLSTKFDGFIEKIEALKTMIDEKLDRKADTQVVERLMDRNRVALNKLRDRLNEIANALNDPSKKDSIDLKSSRTTTSRCSYNSDLIITSKNPNNGNAQITLPKLRQRPDQSHQIIYGQETRSQRAPSIDQSARY